MVNFLNAIFFCFNTSFSRLADSLAAHYSCLITSNFTNRFSYPSQVKYFHHKDTVAVKIENTIFTFYFDKIFHFIVTFSPWGPNPANIYLFKANNRNRIKYEICSKLTIKTPEWSHWRRSSVFIVSFEHFTSFSSVSIIDFNKYMRTGNAINSVVNSIFL